MIAQNLSLKLSFLLMALTALFVSSFAPSQSHAAASSWFKNEHVHARLVASEYKDGKALLGIEFKLFDGWKTYWRVPGDAGIPASANWEGSDNLESATVLWPAPRRFTETIEDITLESFVYSKAIILPVEVEAEFSNIPLDIVVNVDYSVCKEICIPYTNRFGFVLDPGHEDAEIAQLMQPFLKRIPQPNGSQGTSITEVFYDPDAPLTLNIEVASETPFINPDLFIEGEDYLFFPKPDIHINPQHDRLLMRVTAKTYGDSSSLKGERLLLTLVDGGKGIEHRVKIRKTKGSDAWSHLHTEYKPLHMVQRKAKGSTSLEMFADLSYRSALLVMIAFAILGGFILNIMPCVLPVLSVKLLGIIKYGGKHRVEVIHSLLVTAIGIIVSFMVIAGITIALKIAGNAVGWGLQFQQPFFILILLLIIGVFASNLLGFFDIRLPEWLGGSLHGFDHKHHENLVGYFMMGVLATILATPCTAPFLGTALGFALSRSILDIFIIFTAMGFGMSLPYLFFAMFPGLVTRLPKPGIWMVYTKKSMGGLLVLTAIWLLWILSVQLPFIDMVFITLFFALSMYLVTKLLQGARRYRTAYFILSVVSIVLIFTIPTLSSITPTEIEEKEQKAGIWESFDESIIPMYVSLGKTVFVDVTADWCMTCKFNKLRVLNSKKIKNLIKEDEIVGMRADWTNRDEKILNYLSRHQRFGIPFNIVYGPGAPEGIILPELLSKEEVLEAIESAKGN